MNALVRAYRLGHEIVLEFARDEIAKAGNGAPHEPCGFRAGDRGDIPLRGLDIARGVGQYEQERDRWLEHRNSVRAMRIREVLDATDVDLDAITSMIRYPMRRIHQGVVLWLPEETTPGDELARLERFLRELTESLQAQGSSLFVAADRVSAWGWIPLQPEAAETVVADIRQFVANHNDPPALALGSPLPGVEGFRRSHRQAKRARDVAIAAGADPASVIAASDPGFSAAALLSDDLGEAGQWVHEVLGPSSSDTDSDARLRETLRVFLRSGASYKSAADRLHLHSNSIKYRVQRAIERRGRPIGDDRLDVEIALLVCQWFGRTVLLDGSHT